MVMKEMAVNPALDSKLLERFDREIRSRLPHLEGGTEGSPVVNATPLVDVTRDLIDFGLVEYGLDLSGWNVRVLGKMESAILGGSVKVRPAAQMIEDAIASGKLRENMTVFEATSGNFGIALGMMRKLGFDVVVIISRKLKDGVREELKKVGVRALNLDIDICPAPGTDAVSGRLVARAVAASVRDQLASEGFDVSPFEETRGEIEDLLAAGDAINLAKHLARIYHGFCPGQYDNDLNVAAHEVLTGPEIDQQLKALGGSLSEYEVVCTFGTGGTSAGIGRYVRESFGKKSVHVVFPLPNQDVAGIRDRNKTLGLKFYEPGSYAGEHEVDYEAAKPLLEFFAKRGYDIGESSALALFATLQLINRDSGGSFVVILADGMQKYREPEVAKEADKSLEVPAKEVSSNPEGIGKVLWVHPVFVPSERAIELLTASLGCSDSKIAVADTEDVVHFYTRREMTEGIRRFLPNDGRKLLLVCVNGGTSFEMAQSLTRQGVEAFSLSGGVASLLSTGPEDASSLVQLPGA